MGYLVFRTVDVTRRIVLDEVRTLIINSPRVSITASLLIELTHRKIKVIFCDEKHNPCSELLPCYGNSLTTKRVKIQVSWTRETMDDAWALIIRKKILHQASFLFEVRRQAEGEMLLLYADDVGPGDPTNREGHAAKVYFNCAFYPGFIRGEDCLVNAALNYGYSLLLSEINRAVAAAGYLTQLGIHHRSEYNEFCLSSDLIESGRFLVDRKARCLKPEDDWKAKMINLLGEEVMIRNQKQSLGNAINIYVNSFFDAMEHNDLDRIEFIRYGNG